ncbi:M23 family metallopeptidase [Nesterenkonia pannonica]|uniref:peptidoglycan DD-metalloendopeptidase family protein n=1 Tax=Nesterenkonia pannonica TaxID=1548602 RepID=UPI002164D126|nr:M23 family metallopeptidase [Nesterenkonia pannonica]
MPDDAGTAPDDGERGGSSRRLEESVCRRVRGARVCGSLPVGTGPPGCRPGHSPERADPLPADGVVSFSGKVVNRQVLSINHGNGYISSFEPVDSDLTVGDRVSQGQPIGHLDTYDNATHHCDSPACTGESDTTANTSTRCSS